MCPKSKRTLIIPKRKVSSRNFFNHIYACHATNRAHAMSTLKTFWGATATPFFRAVTKKFWNSIKLLIRKDRVHFLMYFRLGLLQGKLAKCNFVLSGCIRWWVAGGFCQGLFQSSLPSFSRKEPFLKVSFILRFFLPFLGYFMDPSKLFVENYTCGTKINEGDNFFGYHNYIEKFPH